MSPISVGLYYRPHFTIDFLCYLISVFF
uniref:Uncharacterized protein n=1 Tax=Arundo donax TaxID=35708 RepID=A0A0A9H373_ARUDO